MNTEFLLTVDIVIVSMVLLISIIVIMRDLNPKSDNNSQPKDIVPRIKVLDVPYDQLVKILDDLVKFNVSSTIILHGLQDKTPEELSVVLDKHIVDISESIFINMGDLLKNSLMQYMSEDYIKLYIVGVVRLVLVARLTNFTE